MQVSGGTGMECEGLKWVIFFMLLVYTSFWAALWEDLEDFHGFLMCAGITLWFYAIGYFIFGS